MIARLLNSSIGLAAALMAAMALYRLVTGLEIDSRTVLHSALIGAGVMGLLYMFASVRASDETSG
jgi:high-affinity Fe2+/Pb2+ permease